MYHVTKYLNEYIFNQDIECYKRLVTFVFSRPIIDQKGKVICGIYLGSCLAYFVACRYLYIFNIYKYLHNIYTVYISIS